VNTDMVRIQKGGKEEKLVKQILKRDKLTGFSSPLMMCVIPRITPEACDVSLEN
jgi:hypothetical protein